MDDFTTPQAHDPSPRGQGQKAKHGTKHGCADLNRDALSAGFPMETSCLLSAWPKTPAACDGEGGTFDGMKAIRENLNPKAKLRDWALVAGFPSASATDASGGRKPPEGTSSTGIRPDGKKAQMGLQTIAQLAAWSTADAAMMNDGADLATHLERLERLKAKHNNGNGAGMPLGIMAKLAGFPMALKTDDQRGRMSAEALKREMARPNRSQGLSLDVSLCAWPTTTRDSKSEGKDGPNRTGAPSLPAVALKASCLLGVDPGRILGLFFVPTGRRVVLAPEFSLWLQGYPEAWMRAAPNYESWQKWQDLMLAYFALGNPAGLEP